MPSKDRDIEREERPSERRSREKREKDPNRPHKSRKPRPIDPETGEPIKSSHRRRKEKQTDSEPSASMAEMVPELARTLSAPGGMERESFPYPTLNKATSKEAVYSLIDVGRPSVAPTTPSAPNVYTPEHTEVGEAKESGSKSRESLKVGTDKGTQSTKDRPLTPPDTDLSQHGKTSTSTTTSSTFTPTRATKIREDEDKHSRPSSRTSERSWFGRPKVIRDDKSKVSTKSRESKASTARRSSKPKVATVEAVGDEEDYSSDETRSQSGLDSNATSIAPKRSQPQSSSTERGARLPGLDTDSGQSNRESASPRTPTATPRFDVHDPKHFARDFRPTPSPFVSFDIPEACESESYDSRMPPPPPPPPMVPMNIPRVDYLMQNGGLSRTIPKALLAVTPSYTSQTMHAGRAAASGPPDIEKVFGPFYSLLDQYETVLAKNGSVAVATGYRSVARRLLDRLETVFARELSSEGCTCIMCEQNEDAGICENRVLGWGDVLEWVCGRRSLPAWPPFDFAAVGASAGLGISGITRDGRPASPQKIDPDIADEFREHYLRQSKKTKAVVDKWLHATPASATAIPPDVDDETLTFTILTHIDSEERPIFNALLAGSNRPIQSSSRAPTPIGKLRSDFIINTAAAIQRLYRLQQPPRDPEVAIYLLNNPEMHHLLVTLSLINNSEWEILVSGRFDGFLWSGAEPDYVDSASPSAAPSRGQTPANMQSPRGPTSAGRHASFSRTFSPTGMPQRNNTFSPPIAGFPSRGPTPNSFMAPMSVPGTPLSGGPGRHPVSNDEDTEIAILAEVEREIYSGMEALEDAFESLHRKAEVVRQALRQRGAGLSMAAQSRRGGSGAFARLGTPGMDGAAGFSGGGYGGAGYVAGGGLDGLESEASESEWNEVRSEIAPDDSASNISTSRHRRPMRRNERRTPAPVEEEGEE